MPVLLTSDLHLTDNSRDHYRHEWVNRLPDLIKETGATELFILGDLTEEKDHHSAELVNQLVAHMYELAQVVPVTVMKGNHDYISPDTPYFGFLSCLDNVRWYNDPTVIDHSELGRTLFLPHTRNYKKDWARFNKFDSYACIFAHNTFKGARSESGARLDGIPLSVFPKDACVYSGDIHRPQTIGPVMYVGAPYTVDFGDDYTPRVLLLDDTGEEEIVCTGPQKRVIELKSPDDLPSLQDLKVSEQDMLKVRVHMTADQYQEWPRVCGYTRTWAERRGYTLSSLTAVVDKSDKMQNEVVDHRTRQSDEEIMRNFAKRRGLNETTLSVGLKLVDET